VLNELAAPWTIGTIQLGIGGAYAALLWFLRLRKAPVLTSEGRKRISKVGFYHGSGQLLSMVSLGAGPVSFTHIVKALEPFFSAMISGFVFKKWMKPQVYATLLPVVGGVGYACLKESAFSWLAFWAAMGSNVAFPLRAVYSKACMISNGSTDEIGQNLGATNLFAVVTLYSFVLSIPAALLFEGFTHIQQICSKGLNGDLLKGIFISGVIHYLNNEVMYLALSNVHPVTLAVGNTMKRVFIIVASVLVFRNPVSSKAAIGSAVGIAGVLLYSLTKQYYEKLEALEQQPAATTTASNGNKTKREL